MKTYIIEVAETHAQIVRAVDQEQAEQIALATARGYDRKVVKTTDVTAEYRKAIR